MNVKFKETGHNNMYFPQVCYLLLYQFLYKLVVQHNDMTRKKKKSIAFLYIPSYMRLDNLDEMIPLVRDKIDKYESSMYDQNLIS